MNKFLLLGFSVLLLSTVAQGLVCKVCKFKFAGVCLNSDEPCQAGHGEFCETTKVFSGRLRLFTKYGCTKGTELCNKTEQRENIFDTSFNRTCCDTDLCNGGVVGNPSFPLFAGLAMALGWWVAH